MTRPGAADCGCRIRTDVEDRVGASFTLQQVGGVAAAIHGRAGGCALPEEPVDDRVILWALVDTGVFAAEIGDPRMRDELDSQTFATVREVEQRARTVLERVERRGHPGAVRR